MSDKLKRVLWADDDAGDTLESLARLFQKRGKMSLSIAPDYQGAINILDKAGADGPHSRFAALIVDTILPTGIRHAALGSYLGIKFAEYAARARTVPAIVFLSVVPFEEVLDQFNSLKARYPEVSFDYFDKLSIYEGKNFEQLLKALG